MKRLSREISKRPSFLSPRAIAHPCVHRPLQAAKAKFSQFAERQGLPDWLWTPLQKFNNAVPDFEEPSEEEHRRRTA